MQIIPTLQLFNTTIIHAEVNGAEQWVPRTQKNFKWARLGKYEIHTSNK